MYGSSTMMVYTTGRGARLHPGPDDRGVPALPSADRDAPGGKYYSVNESNFGRWDKAMQLAVRGLKGETPDLMQPKNSRYIGRWWPTSTAT
jgi:fructose-1,6-bisphosphatase